MDPKKTTQEPVPKKVEEKAGFNEFDEIYEDDIYESGSPILEEKKKKGRAIFMEAMENDEGWRREW